MKKQWMEEIFPGIFTVAHASDTGGQQMLLIDKDDKHYIIVCDGFDYGAWVGDSYEITVEERQNIVNYSAEHGNDWYNTADVVRWLNKIDKPDDMKWTPDPE